jgi:hypothetical protein
MSGLVIPRVVAAIVGSDISVVVATGFISLGANITTVAPSVTITIIGVTRASYACSCKRDADQCERCVLEPLHHN